MLLKVLHKFIMSSHLAVIRLTIRLHRYILSRLFPQLTLTEISQSPFSEHKNSKCCTSHIVCFVRSPSYSQSVNFSFICSILLLILKAKCWGNKCTKIVHKVKHTTLWNLEDNESDWIAWPRKSKAIRRLNHISLLFRAQRSPFWA